jgi:hypothetical protein
VQLLIINFIDEIKNNKNGPLLKWLRGMKMSAEFLRAGVYRPIVDTAYWYQ